jgi:hypothetical protein
LVVKGLAFLLQLILAAFYRWRRRLSRIRSA